ncbi:MAG: hypothetical protein J6A49_10750 [Clostridia bacterium]|nr:hypothetical protein [Clostridia bacterium]
MADCIDCLHFDICQFNEQEQAVINLKPSYRDTSNDIADGCKFFKNKADFVEIPCRCKECEHFNNYNPDRTYCEEHSGGWGDNIVYVDEDDYCSFGIRKRGADNDI